MAYQLEGKNYDFNRVSLQDALKIQNAMLLIAQPKYSSDVEDGNNIISQLALKYLKIEHKTESGLEYQENLSMEYIELAFENEFAIIEILANFQKRIEGFMKLLPSFQQAVAKKQK